MAERGVTVTYETIRAWCYKFGQDYAKRIRARRGQLGDTWHLDEVHLKIGGACSIYGEPGTRMAAFWISLCNRTEIGRLPLGFLRSYCEA